MKEKFEKQLLGLLEDYAKAKALYDKSPNEAKLRGEALSRMADDLQLQGVALQHLMNYTHFLREYENIP